MTPEEITELLNSFKTGTTMIVPMSTTLFPETEALESKLTRNSETAFTLVTTFREFWAGHGWSLEQTETENKSLKEIEGLLQYYERKDFRNIS